MHKISPNLKTPALKHLDKMASNLHEKWNWSVFVEYRARNYSSHNKQIAEFYISLQHTGHPDGCMIKSCQWPEFKALYFNLLNKGISAWPSDSRSQR